MKNEDKNQKFENEKSDSEESGNESPKIEKDNYEELPSLSNTRSQNERNYNLEKPWKNIEKQKIKSKGTELFIGNLNIETKEEELYELFKKYGEIIDVRIKNNIYKTFIFR
jgi:RNA recognition motif-containing protein